MEVLGGGGSELSQRRPGPLRSAELLEVPPMLLSSDTRCPWTAPRVNRLPARVHPMHVRALDYVSP